MFELADLKPSDVFYDLGCGDASVLIFAVNEFGVRKAVGFEREPMRRAKARQHVEREGLSVLGYLYHAVDTLSHWFSVGHVKYEDAFGANEDKFGQTKNDHEVCSS
jgi:cyclopropane fatty-acyl-phospholipid synthase-like methyltransferase